MAGSAQILTGDELCLLLDYVRYTRYPIRNRVIIHLSYKAGLRACEIAGLRWPMVLTAAGKIAAHIALCASVTKGGRRRLVPMHSQLKRDLGALWNLSGKPREGPVIRSERGGHFQAAAIVNWFAELYAKHNLHGCSSHSGRRTFITNTARALSKTGGSLRDIQELAGHAALSTTERYIQGDRAIQRRLVQLA